MTKTLGETPSSAIASTAAPAPGSTLKRVIAGQPLDAVKATPSPAPAATLAHRSPFSLDEPASPVNHYEREHRKVKIDVYRICKLYGITDPAVQHAVKKLLRFGSGQRKSCGVDIAEAIQSLQRWQEMEAEDTPSED